MLRGLLCALCATLAAAISADADWWGDYTMVEGSIGDLCISSAPLPSGAELNPQVCDKLFAAGDIDRLHCDRLGSSVTNNVRGEGRRCTLPPGPTLPSLLPPPPPL